MKHCYTLTNDTRLYRTAVALHPLCRAKWFENNWSNLPGSETELINANTAIKGCWHDYLTSREAAQTATTSRNVTLSPSPTPTTFTSDSTVSKTSTTPATVHTAQFYELMGIKRLARGESELQAARERERLRTKGEL